MRQSFWPLAYHAYARSSSLWRTPPSRGLRCALVGSACTVRCQRLAEGPAQFSRRQDARRWRHGRAAAQSAVVHIVCSRANAQFF